MTFEHVVHCPGCGYVVNMALISDAGREHLRNRGAPVCPSCSLHRLIEQWIDPPAWRKAKEGLTR